MLGRGDAGAKPLAETSRRRRHGLVCPSAATLILTLANVSVFGASATDGQGAIRIPAQAGEPTRLVASRATRDVTRIRRGENGARWVVGWGDANPSAITWSVDIRDAGDYAVSVLLDHESGPAVTIELRAGTSATRVVSHAATAGMRYRAVRLTAVEPLVLEADVHSLVLDVRSPSASPAQLAIFSIELTRQVDRESISATAVGSRARTDAFAAMGHGFMVHYTPESYPRQGRRRSWSEAVRDFDVDGFAEQVQRGGAGFVVLVTAHMRWSFPAPLRSVDALLAGRTTQRDLIDDLATALEKRGIRLMLYLNPAWDQEVRELTGDGPAASERLIEIWNATLSEIGERYGERVFGYWFDRGPWFYEFAPSWAALRAVTRAGNPNRLISWNRSRLPMLTDMQDFESCEKCDDPSAGGHLIVGGDGRYTGGPAPGLQAAATLLAEHPPAGQSADPWVHRWPDTAIGAPRWDACTLARLLSEFKAHRNVPIFNIGIYQDGRLSDETIGLFEAARQIELRQQTTAACIGD